MNCLCFSLLLVYECFFIFQVWIFQVHLVDWLKQMVASRNSEGVLDPKLQEKPSLRSLRRAIFSGFALC